MRVRSWLVRSFNSVFGVSYCSSTRPIMLKARGNVSGPTGYAILTDGAGNNSSRLRSKCTVFRSSPLGLGDAGCRVKVPDEEPRPLGYRANVLEAVFFTDKRCAASLLGRRRCLILLKGGWEGMAPLLEDDGRSGAVLRFGTRMHVRRPAGQFDSFKAA